MKEYHINNVRSQKGNKNSNYRKINEKTIDKIFQCVEQSIVEDHLIVKILIENLKKSFKEYKRISVVWIKNIFGDFNNLIKEYNLKNNTNYKYYHYFRSQEQKKYLSELNKGKTKK